MYEETELREDTQIEAYFDEGYTNNAGLEGFNGVELSRSSETQYKVRSVSELEHHVINVPNQLNIF